MKRSTGKQIYNNLVKKKNFPQAATCAALEAAAPAVFAVIPAGVWHREWVSFCKHYVYGNDVVLTDL